MRTSPEALDSWFNNTERNQIFASHGFFCISLKSAIALISSPSKPYQLQINAILEVIDMFCFDPQANLLENDIFTIQLILFHLLGSKIFIYF